MPNEYGKLIRDGVNYSHDTAESISYDNTNSDLSATDIQSAVDELANADTGHTIINDADTELTQRTRLKFEGVYSSDNSTDEETNVAVVRDMTEAEYALLTDAEKKGIIITEKDRNPSLLTGSMVMYDTTNTVNQAITKTAIASGVYKRVLNSTSITFDATEDCIGYLLIRAYTGEASNRGAILPFGVAGGTAFIDDYLINTASYSKPSSAAYSNGNITFTYEAQQTIFIACFVAPMNSVL